MYLKHSSFSLLRLSAIFVLLLLIQPFASAKPLDQYSTHVWRSQQGLPQNIVKSIAEMPDGYIWVGTQEGLARFDGVNFTTYTTRDTPNLASDNVHYLLVDKPGNLWILAGGGLTRYQAGVFTEYIPAGSATDSVLHMWLDKTGALIVACQYSIRRFQDGDLRTLCHVNGIAARNTSYYTPPCSDSAGRIWFVDDQNGVDFVDPSNGAGATTVYPATGPFGRTVARGLCCDAQGTVWAAGDQGLFRMEQSGPALSAPVSTFGDRPIAQLSADSDGNVWILTDRSLYRMNGGRIELCGSSIGTPDDVTTIFIDDTGVCWLRTKNWHELLRFNHGVFESCLAPDDITQGWEIPITEDSTGDIWVGTVDGVCCLQDLPCRTYTTNDGLAESNVRSVCADSSDRLWVGTTQNGISIMSGNRFAPPADPRLRTGSVGLMASSPAGDMWVVDGSVLYRVRSGKAVDMTADILGTQPGGSIQSLAMDGRGTLWLGTATGLFAFDGKASRHFDEHDGCPTGFVPLVYPDRYGRIWVGGNQSLACLVDGHFTTYSPKDGLPSVPIISMYVDEHGVGWIGSWGEGLYRLDNGEIGRIAVQDGLTADSVQQILPDKRGYLWIGSSKGVFRVRRSVLSDFLSGASTSVECDVFDDDDGATGGVTSQGNQPSATVDSQGVLWFATMQGLERIAPQPLERVPSPVVVEKITVDHRDFDPSRPIVAPAGEGSLQVEYAALTYRASRQIRFSYRLDGYDKTWNPVGDRRDAYYTHLPPGKYRFVVQAFNREGARYGTPAVFALTIQPHFYETVWFRCVIAAIIVLLTIASVLAWTSGLRRRNQELDRKVEERTQELMVAYDELSCLQAELEVQNESLEEVNERLAELATSDGLTGLKNHRSFQEQLEQQYLYAKRYDCELSVLLMDVDNFKSFNDTYGHPMGDQVLRSVADALRECARETDVVARYGGEEFVVILPHTGHAGALEVAERCRRMVEQISGLPRAVTGSFGVATLSSRTAEQSMLTEQADNALYVSKKSGKNRVTHFDDFDRSVKAA